MSPPIGNELQLPSMAPTGERGRVRSFVTRMGDDHTVVSSRGLRRVSAPFRTADPPRQSRAASPLDREAPPHARRGRGGHRATAAPAPSGSPGRRRGGVHGTRSERHRLAHRPRRGAPSWPTRCGRSPANSSAGSRSRGPTPSARARETRVEWSTRTGSRSTGQRTKPFWRLAGPAEASGPREIEIRTSRGNVVLREA